MNFVEGVRRRCSRMIAAESAPAGVAAITVAILALIIFLRSPTNLLNPQFYAEDGYIFFQSAWERGFLPSLLEPYSGYLHVVPRVVAGLALLVPLLQAPLVFNLAAFAITLIPVLYLLSKRMRSLPSFSARLACALLFVAMPASKEIYVNITNAHWYLMFAACFALAAEPPVNRRQLAADTLVLGFYALSSPLALIFLPVAAAKAWRDRGRAGLVLPWLPLGALGLGVALQVATSLSNPRVVKGLGVAYGALPLVREFVMFGFFNVVLGMWGNYRHFASFGTASYLLGFAALLALTAACIRRRSRLGLLLLYAAVAVFAIEHIFPVHPGSRRDEPIHNLRYYTLLVFYLLYAAREAAASTGVLRYLGAAVLATTLLVGIPGDFRLLDIPDTHYEDQVAVFRSLGAGASFSFPTTPINAAPMVLRRRGEPGGRTLLDGRSLIPEPAVAYLGSSFDNPDPGKATVLTVEGIAYDKNALKPPGSVLVVVNNRLFPATTFDLGEASGYEFMRPLPSYRRAGYSRSIPIAEIGRGRHDLSLIVLTHDRRSYFQPTAMKTITVP